MTEDEKKFSKEVNIDKAINKAKVSLGLVILSVLSYFLPIIMGEFDFGIIFEACSLFLLVGAMIYMEKYNVNLSRILVIGAIIPVVLLLLYDLFLFISCAQNEIELALIGWDYYFQEFFSILYVGSLLAILKDLAKADNPIKYKESTDWFYENYEKK